MKTFFRSFASIVLGVFLWFVLHIALTFVLLLIAGYAPKLLDVIDVVLRFLRSQHWYQILFMGIPAIIPAILCKLIMSGTSEKAQIITLVSQCVLVSLIVLFFYDFTLYDKLQGIFGACASFFIFGKEN